MKKIALIFSLLVINQVSLAQTTIEQSNYTSLIDSLYTLINKQIAQSNKYEVYILDNIPQMFLRLDTQTGKIKKIKNKSTEITIINDKDLSIKSSNSLFKLYPTQDPTLYVLLDKTTGRMWNIYWNKEDPKQRIQQIQ